MKKALLFLLVLCMLFTVAACNTDSTPNSSKGFQKPPVYAAVLSVRLNPHVNLYLSPEGTVLAVEPLNADAEQIVGQIATDTDYQTAVASFVTASYAKGYVKTDAKLYLEVTETPHSQTDIAAILDEAVSAASTAAQGKDIALEVETVGKPVHQHSFDAATCQKPATCACGETQGDVGAHNYKDGACIVCGDSPAVDPNTALQQNVEYIGNLRVSGNMLYGSVLQFEEGVCVVVSREYITEPQEDGHPIAFEYQGTAYYSLGGGMEPYNVELTDTAILVKGSLWGEDADTVTVQLILQSNGLLKVTESTNRDFPVGTLLSTNIYDIM